MKEGWDDLRAAGAFLTILPLARGVEFDSPRLARSMAWFPLVGLLIGLALVLADQLLAALLPRPLVDGLLLLLLIWISGALHLDGLADLTDGLAGGQDRNSSLKIMKDSRVGAIGAVALVMDLLLKYLALSQLPPEQRHAALLLLPATGRWCQVFLAVCSSYIRPEGGTAAAFVDRVGKAELCRASLTLLAAALLLFSLEGMLIIILLIGFAGLLLHFFERRLGGVTGDILGGATELTEVFFLLLVLILFS